MGSSSREDEVLRARRREAGGIGKMGGGSGSRSRKKMKKAVSRNYAFIAGTRVPSGACGVLGWQASWATHCGCAAWAVNKSGEVGQPGRKGRGGPGQAGRLGPNGRRFGFMFKWNLSWVLSGFWSNKI
jgi:hypothetical protein